MPSIPSARMLIAPQLKIMEARGSQRRELYHRIKKLYDVRSKVVHGVAMRDAEMVSHVAEVRKLLSKMVCTLVESGKVFSDADFESALLE